MVGFLNAVPAIDGNILSIELLRIFRHFIECAQSTIMAYHELNFLFLVVRPLRLARLQQRTAPHTPNTAGHESAVH